MPGRRKFLAGSGALAAAVLARLPEAHAQQSAEFTQAYDALVAGKPVTEGRVVLEIPRLADNGNSVPLRVRVEGPGRVARITLLSPRNPRPVMASFFFGPRAGHAEVVTRARLNGTQRVVAIAQLADGTLWSGYAQVEVTESACLDMG